MRSTDPVRNRETLIRFLDSLANFEKGKTPANKRDFRLDRMHMLLERFGNPQEDFQTIHVAGTKGKGSTAAMMASVLKAAGYRTGLYTSPHVTSYLERFAVSGEAPKIGQLARLAEAVRRRFSEFRNLPGGFEPTTFEILTLLAMMLFRESRCSHAVLEVGIGGRLDATNVVKPKASVLTPLDLEHTDLLGDSIQEIAREKGGIIKAGVPAFCGLQSREAKSVFRDIAEKQNAPIRFLDEELVSLNASLGWDGTAVSLAMKGGREEHFRLSLLGKFQAENAALAYLTLSGVDPDITSAAYRRGFGEVSLPGRLEILQRDPPVILDGAHTPLAVERMLESYRVLCHEPGVLIFGSVVGKRADLMVKLLAPHFHTVIVSTPGSFKESRPEEVHALFREAHDSVVLEKNPSRALEKAMRTAGKAKPILVTGSFYMLSEIRRIWLERPAQEG